MIISAFPTIGKTFAYNQMKDIKGLKVLDSDSSKFSWIYETEWDMKRFEEIGDLSPITIRKRNPDFPNNYIKHIKDNMNDATYIFVSSHENVRQAMKESGVPYVLVYPRRDMLPEIVGRCYLRGSDEQFIKVLIENWDSWIDSCEKDMGATDKRILGNNEHLLDLIENMSHR